MSRHAATSGQRRPQLVAVLTVLGVLILIGTASALAVSHRAQRYDAEPPPSAAQAPSGSPTTYAPGTVLTPGVTDGVPDDVGNRKQARRLARLVEAEARRGKPAEFRVASFNVLGASHTTSGGNKPRYAAGTTRMGWALEALRGQQVDVVGFQEYEPIQHAAFMRATGGSWGVFPGSSEGNRAIRNSIAWREDTWSAVQLKTVPIPYFRGTRVPMPYVQLEHKKTSHKVWFINIHNPVTNKRRGNNEHWRDVATAIEVDLIHQLSAKGTPVILTGDFNERGEAFCKLTAAGAVAANGGLTSPCVPPLRAGIDWIFGAQVAFSGYVRLPVARVSDHPLIAATALAPPPES